MDLTVPLASMASFLALRDDNTHPPMCACCLVPFTLRLGFQCMPWAASACSRKPHFIPYSKNALTWPQASTAVDNMLVSKKATHVLSTVSLAHCFSTQTAPDPHALPTTIGYPGLC